MPGSRGSEEAAKFGTLNTATRQLNLSLILYAVPFCPSSLTQTNNTGWTDAARRQRTQCALGVRQGHSALATSMDLKKRHNAPGDARQLRADLRPCLDN